MPSVRLIKHEAVPKCGSYEVRFLAGKPSRYFYWEDLPSRRLRPEQMTGEEALEQARAFARAERDRRWPVSALRRTDTAAPRSPACDAARRRQLHHEASEG